MIHAKKMILVTPEEASRIRSNDPTSYTDSKPFMDPTTPMEPAGSLNALDVEMRRILESRGPSDQEKWTLYRQVLLTFMSKLREKKKVAGEESDITSDETQDRSEYNNRANETGRRSERSENNTYDAYNNSLVEEYTTERERKKAIVLINLLRRNADITWDNSGAVTIKAIPIATSFAGLLRAAISGSKKDRPPGWTQFYDLLQHMNVPRPYVKRAQPLMRQVRKGPRVKIAENRYIEKRPRKWQIY